VTLDTTTWPSVVFTISRKRVDKGTMTLKVCPHLPTPDADWVIDRVKNLALCAACYEENRKTSPAPMGSPVDHDL
jgi:hypothetical protein